MRKAIVIILVLVFVAASVPAFAQAGKIKSKEGFFNSMANIFRGEGKAKTGTATTTSGKSGSSVR